MPQHSLLQTKFYIPPIRPELVPRPRLLERLDKVLPRQGAFPRSLTLISAPAGFGKTTLVSEWIQALDGAAPPIAVAWLSLDQGDNDPTLSWPNILIRSKTHRPGCLILWDCSG